MNRSSLILKNINILVCPVCGGRISGTASFLKCSRCRYKYKFTDGILSILNNEALNEVTAAIKSFYEGNPFLSYRNFDSCSLLLKKAKANLFTRLLDEQIPLKARILEIGCGTGQLSNFLALARGRTVFATDISLNSLKEANGFKKKNNLKNIAFLQMDLGRPAFKPESFDLVICSGVLHHTADAYAGFNVISNLVKKGGFVLLGLYNKYGRIPTKIRKILFRISGGRFKFLDPILRDKNISEETKRVWFMDQYQNPHESVHTIDEVLGWFDRNDFEFVSSVPKTTPFAGRLALGDNIFQFTNPESKIKRFFLQLGMLLGGGEEGGFFVMVGRKKL